MSDASGRRQTAVICCASLLKDMYLKPIAHYNPDRVYVFVNNGEDSVSVAESAIFESVRPLIGCGNVFVRRGDTHDLKAILCDIMDIKTSLYEEYGDYLDIFINISSGTNEFSAAAFFASTARPRSVPFTVGVDADTTPEALREAVTALDADVSDPVRVIPVTTNNPDDDMVAFLSVMGKLLETTRYPRPEDVIAALKMRGAWSYDPSRKHGTGKTDLRQKERMYLRRNYIEKALAKGWLEKVSENRYALTDIGRMFMSVYERKSMDTLPDNVCLKDSLYASAPMFDRMDLVYYSCPNGWGPDAIDEYQGDEPASDSAIVIEDCGRSYRFRVDTD